MYEGRGVGFVKRFAKKDGEQVVPPRPEGFGELHVRLKGKIMKKTVIMILATVSVSGCVTNPYSQFYQDYTGGTGVVGNPMLIVLEKEPVVQQGSDPLKDEMEMIRNGYVLIGESSFNAGSVATSNAKYHARRVGAEIVLLYSQYTDTVSGSMPLTLPDTKHQRTYGSASAYGSGGYANAYGSSHTTTYGTRTTYIPYNVQRYDYLATFWTRSKPLSFGAQFQDLTDEQRRQIQSNKGVSVFVVVKGTPAFQNDILEGDIIRQVNSTDIMDVRHCLQVIGENKGKTVSLTILRNGREVQKEIRLNQ